MKILYIAFLVACCKLLVQASISDGAGVPLQQPETSASSTNLPKFVEVMTSFRSIYLSWSVPYFPLRMLLLFGRDKEDLSTIQLGSGTRNHTLESLEPGTSYRILIQVYYSSADLDTVSKVVTTIPNLPSIARDKMKIEIRLLLIDEGTSESFVARELTNNVKKLVSDFADVENVYVYSIQKDVPGLYVILYVEILQRNTGQAVFYRIRDNMSLLKAKHIGFRYKIFQGCCKPLYFHSFNDQTTSKKDNVLSLKIIPNNAFSSGKCHKSLDMGKGDVTVQTRGQHSLDALTFSLYFKLKHIKGLHPIISSVNYNTQLRLEVQDGKLVWMFYNIRNSKGFIVSTQRILKANTWVHILVDYEANGGVGRIFTDGVFQTKVLSHVALSSNWMLGLRIGKYYSGGLDYKMDGYLDDLHVFDCVMTLQHIHVLSKSCGEVMCDSVKLQGPDKFVLVKQTTEKNTDTVEKKKGGANKCNQAGSLPSTQTKNKCRCKDNVKGYYCDTCVAGTFNLQQENKYGCLKCFCNGLTTDCRSAKLERKQTVLNAQDIRNLNLRTIDDSKLLQDNLLYNPLTNSVSYKYSSTSTSTDIYYWELPLRYCGDKVASYGGNLRYTISYLSRPIDKPLYGADVVLMGNNLELHYTERTDPLPGQQHYYQVILDEKFWKHRSGYEVSREEMIIALAGIKSFLLRATFSSDMIETNLYEVRLDVAGYNPLSSNDHVAPMVEECNCPPQYFGTSCQHCNKGYTKMKNGKLLGRCEECQCNGHAVDCDGKTGQCRDCQHYTTGAHCEKCLPGYYGDPRSGQIDACRPCPCPLSVKSNQFSSTCVLDTDGQPTCDACKPGHTGRQCERCLSPFLGDPTKPGDYCKIPKDSKCRDCDERGSIDSTCDRSTGNCVCKKNVEGRKCTQCKEGTFNLDKKNSDGCLSCWCFGVSSTCDSAKYYRRLIKLTSIGNSLKITDFDEALNIRQGFYANTKELVLTGVDKLAQVPMYWSMPRKFLGNKITSYGGYISYVVSYEATSTGKPYLKPDIKLVGQDQVLISETDIIIENRQLRQIKVALKEDDWTTLSGAKVSREEFLNVLVDLKSFLIRATYSTGTRISSLRNVEMADSVAFNLRLGVASSVERCHCPRGYTGLSCEKCDKGYTRHVDAFDRATCKKCECNGHSDNCDKETGVCVGCKSNTQGDHCDECMAGYYGDAVNGRCERCACPLLIKTNQFSTTCVVSQDGGYTCDRCQQGYDGSNCGKCSNGYTGNPMTPGGTCKKVAQSYNAAPSVQVVPRRRSDRNESTATFKCTVHGTQPLTIMWARIDGRPFSNRVYIHEEGNSKTLTIRNLKFTDQETYICSGRNEYGLNSVRATLLVLGHKMEPIRAKVTPKSMRIEQGGVARFLCRGLSQLTSTIRWNRDGNQKLPNEAIVNHGVLTIPNVQRRHSGLYTCTASNQYTTDRVSAQLRVGVVVPPQASVQPSYQTVDIGDNIKFRCSINGYPAPKISWKRGHGKAMLDNVEITDNSLRIKNIVIGNEGSYQCIATNRGGSVTRRAVLYVRGPNSLPTILIQPSERYAKPGSLVRFLCSISGSSAEITWRKSNGKLPLRSFIRNGELQISSVAHVDQGLYTCSAKNAYGTVHATAKLVVLLEPGYKPTTLLSPKFATVIEGKSIFIKCNVTGSPSPLVLWSKPNGLLTSNHVVKGHELRIIKAVPTDSGTYVCTGQNKLGVHSSTSVISVERRLSPKLTVTGPHHRTVYAGDKTTFFCKSTSGIPKPTLHWISSGGYRVSSRYIKEAHGGLLLKFAKLFKSHEGNYSCVGINIAGRVEEKVSIKVKGDPRVHLKPRGLRHVAYGDKVKIECYGFGHPVPAVVMAFPSSINISTKDVKINNTKGYLRVEFVADFDFSGMYSCKGASALGEKHDWLNIRVNSEDKVPTASILPSQVTAKVGDEVKLFCDARGVPNPKVYWTRDNSRTKISHRRLLHIDSVEESDAGEYHCRAKNRKGSSRVSATLNIVVPPTAKISPEYVVVKKGRSFNLKCQVLGSPAPTIEWKKVGTNELSYQSLLSFDNELVATAARAEDAGTYVCTATNIHGVSRSSAEVTVVEPPWIVTSNKSRTYVSLKDRITLHCESTGYPKPSIKWLIPSSSTAASRKDILTIDEVTKFDHGQYKCQASNSGGIIEETFTVVVNEIPRANIDVDSVITLLAGTQKSIHCKGYGQPKPSLLWSKINDNMPRDVIIRGGGLHFSKIHSKHAGTYRCLAENKFASVLSEVQIIVKGDPVISVSPKVLKVNFKEKAKFYCSATGSPNPKITWFKLNGNLPEERYIKRDFFLISSVKPSDAGTYICRAENDLGISEGLVQLQVYEFVPSFNTTYNSMIMFDKMEYDLHTTRITISVKPLQLEGLLFYSGKASKDFISISLRDGFVVFQYDLGSGQSFIRSKFKVSLSQWVTIVASRDESSGYLQVDNQQIVAGKSGGKYRRLNLNSEIFLGGHENYDKIVKQVNLRNGFTGCISQLVVNGVEKHFVLEPLLLRKVVACKTCSKQSCLNGGECWPGKTRTGKTCKCPASYTGLRCEERVESCYPAACKNSGKCTNNVGNGYTCKCILGRYGKRCGKGHSITIPSFHRKTYISYKLTQFLPNSLTVSISFKILTRDDVEVFSIRQKFRNLQKFLKIHIQNGKVVLKYDLGDGVVVITTKRTVDIGKWINVYAEQRRKYASLSVNNGQAYKNVSSGRHYSLSLNAKSTLVIGGGKRGELPGMLGCIRELIMNGKRINLAEDFIEAKFYSSCYKFNSPCLSQPCLHGGTCHIISKESFKCKCLSKYTGKTCDKRVKSCGRYPDCKNGGKCSNKTRKGDLCMCPIGYTGTSCEKATSIGDAILFNEESFLVYPKSLIRRVERSRILISMKTREQNGLLLWFGQNIDISPDFLLLGLRNGYFEVQYELGSGLAEGRSHTRVSDGEWHDVEITRNGSTLGCTIDGKREFTIYSEGRNRNLDVYSNLILGGGEDVSVLSRRKFSRGFQGCVKDFKVEGRSINFNTKPERGFNIHPCDKE